MVSELTATVAIAELLGILALLVLIAPIGGAAVTLTRARLDLAYAVAVGIAAVIAALVLVGLALSATVGVDAAGWIAGLLVVDLVALAAVLVGRRARGAPEARDSREGGMPRRRLLLAGPIAATAVALAVAAVAISHSSAAREDSEITFTQLWILPEDEQSASFEVGVRNLERSTVDYRLTVRVAKRLRLDRTLVLEAGESFVETVGVARGRRVKGVVARLWRPDRSTPYRKVDAWVPAG